MNHFKRFAIYHHSGISGWNLHKKLKKKRSANVFLTHCVCSGAFLERLEAKPWASRMLW